MKIVGKASISFCKIICVSSTLLLISCASVTSISQQDRETWILSASKVAFSARTVIKHRKSAYHFNLNWQQEGDLFTAQGFDLLGRQIFQISGNQQMVLFRRDGKEEQKSSREVIASQIGVDLKPIQLLHLLEGLHNKDYQSTNNNNLLKVQKNQNLIIHYNSYSDHKPFPMPSKVTVQTGDTEVKMVLYSWQLDNNTQ